MSLITSRTLTDWVATCRSWEQLRCPYAILLPNCRHQRTFTCPAATRTPLCHRDCSGYSSHRNSYTTVAISASRKKCCFLFLQFSVGIFLDVDKEIAGRSVKPERKKNICFTYCTHVPFASKGRCNPPHTHTPHLHHRLPLTVHPLICLAP